MASSTDTRAGSTVPLATAALRGLLHGARTPLDPDPPPHARRPEDTRLARLYLEPTARCNLACVTCIRNDWREPGSEMSDATFAAVLDGLATLAPRPTVFFGGFGEPLSHPRILDMIAATHALGCRVEMITNATLLTERVSREVIAAGLDRLWVSLDGAQAESYADVRLGAALPEVLRNVAAFSAARSPRRPRQPEIGIAFVAMRRNIGDLPHVLEIGRGLGAMHFLVTNVLPYTSDMVDEILYERA